MFSTFPSKVYNTSDLTSPTNDSIVLHYVRVSDVPLWSDNPKLADVGGIITSIEQHGFRDPSAWDAKLKAPVEGNHRVKALLLMEKNGYPVPRNILLDDEGRWCMPMLFGGDALSREAAKAYGIDHNNLTITGGDMGISDLMQMWDEGMYISTLEELALVDNMPVSVDLNDLESLSSDVFYTTEDLLNNDSLNNESDDLLYNDGTDVGNSELQPSVIKVVIMNTNLKVDVIEAIEALLSANPGWDARLDYN